MDGKRKVFHWLTYGSLGGELGWHSKAPAAPRHLYGLDRLADRPDATVIVCEGEKACIAAAHLFPDHVCVSWSGGSSAVHLADWTPLEARRLTLWPDADEAGRKAVAWLAERFPNAQIVNVDDKDDGWDAANLREEGVADPEVWLHSRTELPPVNDSAPDNGSSRATPSCSKAAENGNPVDDLMAEFNASYMVVNENGKAIIYAPRYDDVLKRDTFDRITFDDLKRLYDNRSVVTGTDDGGNPIRKKAATVWLQHPLRRQFIGGVCFDPSGNASRDGVLNLWKGWAVKPCPGDWSLLREHTRRIICRGNAEAFDYLMGWMARMIQHPAEQGEVAVVMKGLEGTDKGTLAKALKTLMGQHALQISHPDRAGRRRSQPKPPKAPRPRSPSRPSPIAAKATQSTSAPIAEPVAAEVPPVPMPHPQRLVVLVRNPDPLPVGPVPPSWQPRPRRVRMPPPIARARRARAGP